MPNMPMDTFLCLAMAMNSFLGIAASVSTMIEILTAFFFTSDMLVMLIERG